MVITTRKRFINISNVSRKNPRFSMILYQNARVFIINKATAFQKKFIKNGEYSEMLEILITHFLTLLKENCTNIHKTLNNLI